MACVTDTPLSNTPVTSQKQNNTNREQFWLENEQDVNKLQQSMHRANQSLCTLIAL